jgi:hypothetical protein
MGSFILKINISFTPTVIDDELHQDMLYSAVVNITGFTEEALLVALCDLMDNNA